MDDEQGSPGGSGSPSKAVKRISQVARASLRKSMRTSFFKPDVITATIIEQEVTTSTSDAQDWSAGRPGSPIWSAHRPQSPICGGVESSQPPAALSAANSETGAKPCLMLRLLRALALSR